MTLNEHVEYLRNYINQFENITEVEVIRIVYIYLGKKLKFDARYGYGSRKEKDQIYDSTILRKIYSDDYDFYDKVIKYIIINEEEIRKRIEDGYMICTSISGTVEYILKQFGIKVDHVVELPEYGQKMANQHVYNIVTLKDGRKAKLDLEQDLGRIQSLSKTKNFLININTGKSILSDEVIREIDMNKADYIPEGFYFEDMFYMVKLSVSGTDVPLEEKVKMIIKNLGAYTKDYKEMGYVQRRIYHEAFFRNALSTEELDKINFLDCFYEKKNESYKTCIIVELPNKEYKIYMFSLEDYKYEEITKEDLANEISKGIKIHENKKVPIQGFNKYLKELKKLRIEAKVGNKGKKKDE